MQVDAAQKIVRNRPRLLLWINLITILLVALLLARVLWLSEKHETQLTQMKDLEVELTKTSMTLKQCEHENLNLKREYEELLTGMESAKERAIHPQKPLRV